MTQCRKMPKNADFLFYLRADFSRGGDSEANFGADFSVGGDSFVIRFFAISRSPIEAC